MTFIDHRTIAQIQSLFNGFAEIEKNKNKTINIFLHIKLLYIQNTLNRYTGVIKQCEANNFLLMSLWHSHLLLWPYWLNSTLLLQKNY